MELKVFWFVIFMLSIAGAFFYAGYNMNPQQKINDCVRSCNEIIRNMSGAARI
jgi:hypothetical protein